jgi:hypothetical protein
MGKCMKARLVVFDCLESIWGKSVRAVTNYSFDRLHIERSLYFMAAHLFAQEFLHSQFEDSDCTLSESGKVVFAESQELYEKAKAVLVRNLR